MSTTGRPSSDAPAASDLAAILGEAGLVRLVAASDGDALAALGLLGRACAATDVPFQATVAPAPEPPERATDADATIALGRGGGDIDLRETPASPTAYEAANELATAAGSGHEPDPLLALAGVCAAGDDPGQHADLLTDATDRGVERQPGVAIPTDDLVDGLAHTTLAHTSLSADPDAIRTALAERDLPTEASAADEPAHRRVASLLSLLAVEDAPPRAAEIIEHALHPYVITDEGGFATLGGYGDVLESCARERPGTAVALALGHDVRESALDAWRVHARSVHEALGEATMTRHSGVVVYRLADAAPVRTIAWLAHAFTSPEPTTLVVTDGEVAAAGDKDVSAPLRLAASDAGGAAASAGDGRTAYGRHEDADRLIAAFREART